MKLLLTLLTIFIAIASNAQSAITYNGEAINRLDENGNKVGIWKLYEVENGTRVEIDYTSQPVVTKFYKNDTLREK